MSKGEIRQSIWPPRCHSVVQGVDLRDAALVRHRYLAVQHHGDVGGVSSPKGALKSRV